MILLIYGIVLIILSIIMGKKRGVRSVLSLLINFIIIVFSLVFINLGFSIYFITFLAYLGISLIIIFYLNGYNIKTKSAFIGVIIVTIINSLIILYLNNKLHLGSFSYEFVDEISAYSFNISLSLKQISFMVLLFICTGSICDTAVAISSALYKDIIGTTVNTLLFSFIAGFIGYILWHNYDSFLDILNYHGFASEVIELICAIIGCLLIIPITTFIEIKLLKKN